MTSQPGMISFLTELIGTDVAPGDFLELLDVDDTSMASTGTNRKVQVANLLGARPPASVSVGNAKAALIASFPAALTSSGTVMALPAGTFAAGDVVVSQSIITIPAFVAAGTLNFNVIVWISNTAGTNTFYVLYKFLTVSAGAYAGATITVDYTAASPVIVGADLSVDGATHLGIKSAAGGFYTAIANFYIN